MITVTAQAAEELKAMAQGQVTEAAEGLRLVPAGSGQLALTIDTVKEGDQVVEHEGVKILLVGPELADAVDGLVVDVKDTSEGRRLTISGPAPEA